MILCKYHVTKQTIALRGIDYTNKIRMSIEREGGGAETDGKLDSGVFSGNTYSSIFINNKRGGTNFFSTSFPIRETRLISRD